MQLFLAPRGSAGETVDDAISPPVAALLKNQDQDNLLEDVSPIRGSSPGKFCTHLNNFKKNLSRVLIQVSLF
jgi:hypothetical protein